MRHPFAKRGFTLIELLAAVAVSGLLILACGVIMKSGADDRQTVTCELAWERELSRVVESLSGDLAAAQKHRWHEGRGGDSGVAAWLTLMPLSGQRGEQAIGDLCAVSYGLRDVSVAGTQRVVRRLMRQQSDSETVHRALRENDEASLWRLGRAAEPLADGVLVFELWPLLADGPASWQPWHPELQVMPDAVEMRLVLASRALQQRLHSAEDWNRAQTNPERFSGVDVREIQTLIHLRIDAD